MRISDMRHWFYLCGAYCALGVKIDRFLIFLPGLSTFSAQAPEYKPIKTYDIIYLRDGGKSR